MKNKKRLDKFAKRRIRLLLFIFFFIICLFVITNKDKNVYDNYRLIIGENYIQLIDDIYIDDSNNIYLSKEDIMQLYDSNIYYEQIENMLITTYNKHIAILKLNEYKMNINGSEIETKAALTKINNKIYLPFSEMKIIYDFEYTYCDETKTIIVDSISEEKKEVTVIKKTAKIKKEPKLFSSKIEKIKKDNTITIIEELENYYKVRTNLGNIGYVSKRKVGDVEKVRDFMEDSKIKEINFLEYDDITKDYSDIEIDKNKKNAVILNLFNIKNFNIEEKIDFSSTNYSEYMNWAEENKIMVLATITCDDEIIDDFLSYDKRNSLIQELYKKIVNNKINGVNIEFKNINDVNCFYRFIIELAPMFRESGIKTIVTSNSVLKEEKLKSIVDYVIK